MIETVTTIIGVTIPIFLDTNDIIIDRNIHRMYISLYFVFNVDADWTTRIFTHTSPVIFSCRHITRFIQQRKIYNAQLPLFSRLSVDNYCFQGLASVLRRRPKRMFSIRKMYITDFRMALLFSHEVNISRLFCQKGPTRHAYAWQIWPFWQDTLDIFVAPVPMVHFKGPRV